MPRSFCVLVIFPDVFSCFLFDGLAYFCVLNSLFVVAVFYHLLSFRRNGSCW